MLTALVVVASLSVAGYACLLALHRQGVAAAGSRQVVSGISALVSSQALGTALRAASSAGDAGKAGDASGAAKPGAATGRLALTASERRDCPATAAACVDLTGKITWLQAAGKVSYGPVRMEPGPLGSQGATPAGTFHVTGKAGPGYVASPGHQPTPWAVFLAPGDITIGEGSLAQPSAGCLHLSMASARSYNQRLRTGAEVVVFS
jgi:hypothetical protein